MKNVAKCLIAALVLGLALAGCSNPATETEVTYVPAAPNSGLSLSQLIELEGGAFFQCKESRSLRFFADGVFEVFNMGLFMDIQPEATYGGRYKVEGNTIQIYRAADAANAAPFYTITYNLEGQTLTVVSKANGTGTAPNDTNIPVAKYSYGKLPYFRY